MAKARIIRRKLPAHDIFVIQMKHPIYIWKWVDAWIVLGESVKDYFDTLGEAQEKLELFKNFPSKRDIPIGEINKPGIQDLSKQRDFWIRLEDFVKQVHVDIHDKEGYDEKEMFLKVCRRKMKEYDI